MDHSTINKDTISFNIDHSILNILGGFTMSVLNITKDSFEQDVLNQTEKPVLVDFWAPWCGPCRMLGPVVEQLAENHGDKVIVGKVNVDEQPELASKFNVTTIPTLIVFNNGKVTNTSIGVISEDEMLELL